MHQSNKPYKGFFVTIEGGDGCGKTTVAQRLVTELQKKSYKVVKTREPGGTPLSEQIRTLLLTPQSEGEMASKAELLLYLAARAQNFSQIIQPALLEGKIVICERFHDSTVAYQGAARHLGMPYVEKLCCLVTDHPDCTLLLDLDPEEGMRRVQTIRQEPMDRLEQERLPFHWEVRQGYLHQADAHPNRIVIIDASQTIEHVIDAALKVLESRLKQMRASSL